MKFSVVVPIYNDGELATDFCSAFAATFRAHLGTADISSVCEVLFVNDGSPNDSQRHLEQVAASFDFVRVIQLSRNYGQHIAISCGYRNAQGEFVAMMNVDQEDPPSELPGLFQLLIDDKFDLVVGLRTSRDKQIFRDFTSTLFHLTLNKLTGHDVPLNCATMRVMNRRFLEAYNGLKESSRYLPGLEMWMGFRRGYVDIRNQSRTKGMSSYNFRRRLKMAVDSILSFSDLPLRLVVTTGFFVTICGFLLTILLVIQRIYMPDVLPGYTSIAALVICVGGVQIAVTGVTGLYIGRVLREVQHRPLYLIQKAIGLKSGGR